MSRPLCEDFAEVCAAINALWESIVWQYGWIGNRTARRHRLKRNVQFLFWEPGQEGCTEPYWKDYDRHLWAEFEVDR